MKLKRENFKKVKVNNVMTYSYECNDIVFYLQVDGDSKANRKIYVFKGSPDDKQELFETTDSLEAWNKLEEYLTACQPEQSSSGGFKNNPQQNPSILPLLAIRRIENGNMSVIVFADVDGNQIELMNFEVELDSMPSIIPDNIFLVDWKDQEIPTIFKCEVVMKKINNIIFKEDDTRSVFLFIPKSIVEQGGEESGNTEAGEEGEESEEKGEKGEKGKKQEKGEKGQEQEAEKGEQGEEGEQGDENKEGEQEKEAKESESKKGKEKENKLGEESEGQSSKESEQESKSDEEGENQEKENQDLKNKPNDLKEKSFSEIITTISDITNTSPSTIINVFRNESLGETWLLTNNFKEIKNRLSLPESTTARELSKTIINLK
jgi:hypothetical protein